MAETGGKFRLLAGIHDEGNGRIFSKGDVFESPNDLDKMFANKFERLSGPTKVPAARDDTLNRAGQVMDAPLHQRQAAAQQTQVSPQPFVDSTPSVILHSKNTPREQTHGPDDVFPGEEHKAQKAQTKASAETEEEEETDVDYGADVSDQFESAQKVGLEVYKNENGYTVVKDGDPVRKTPFGNKKEVNGWVRKNRDKLQKEQEEAQTEESEEANDQTEESTEE